MSSFLPPKTITGTLAPGQSRDYDGPGSFARLVEANGALSIGFDLGTFIPNCQVGQAWKCRSGESFSRIRVENPAGAAADVTYTIVAGDIEMVDDRVHINTTTLVPVQQSDPNFAVGGAMDSTPQTAAAAAGVLLLPADPTRREAWLWTDESSNAAWFAESAAQLAAPLDFQRIGMTIEGFTKLRTRSAIYVKAANGVKVGAIVFKA